HMVHGGIRYLENGEFRLVREAVAERNRLINNAPHQVTPLATVIPIFRRLSGILNAPLKFLNLLDRPSERGALVIKAGLMMYDAYTGADRTVPKHRFNGREKSLREFPDLNPAIINTAIYYDGAMPAPERICIDMLVDTALMAPGASAINYLSAVGAEKDEIVLHDEIDGTAYRVKPQLVINAAGPWIDLTNQAMGRSTHFMGGTKGSHLVLDHPELLAAIRGNEFFFENDDGRIVLIYPLQNRVLIGTSDIKITDPDDARCTEEEIDYFFALVNRVFPRIDVSRDQIVFRFSGVRPLPSSEASSTGQISRDHSNRVQEPDQKVAMPVYNLIGGKWTSHRAFAEQVTDRALADLGQHRVLSTREMPFGGGRDYPEGEVAQESWLLNLQAETELPMEQLRQLFNRYGTRAAVIGAFIGAENDEPLRHQPDYSRREIIYLAEHEDVQRLDDLCLRRTQLGMLGYLTGPLLTELADILAGSLNWSAERRQTELDRTLALLADKHGLHLSLA
ncbi:MAG: glycerol-3-phosphate dehydrogenase/oxidase, partial [Anaerolineales bacterium]|nr:glycerol-3-phosphate dehydrogenase/oxidase [Anaerolineales bacterium]